MVPAVGVNCGGIRRSEFLLNSLEEFNGRNIWPKPSVIRVEMMLVLRDMVATLLNMET